LVMGGLIGVPMLATETWLRRRGRLGRFKIIDFLVVVALFAAGFGLWRWDKSITDRERAAMTKLYSSSVLDPQYQSGYIGPEWASRLCGNSYIVPVLQRIVEVKTDGGDFTDFDATLIRQ